MAALKEARERGLALIIRAAHDIRAKLVHKVVLGDALIVAIQSSPCNSNCKQTIGICRGLDRVEFRGCCGGCFIGRQPSRSLHAISR
eukprot:7825765-Pyramimonas_sp.AAC.1